MRIVFKRCILHRGQQRRMRCLALLSLAGCGFAVPAPAVGPAPLAPCQPGVIIVHGDEPTPCDLIGDANTLTILDISEAECDLYGGRFVEGECRDTDF